MDVKAETILDVGELKVKVVSDEQCEQSDYVACVKWSTPGHFDDDLQGTCCRCGVSVRFRPHAPKKPPRICLQCLLKEVEEIDAE